MNNYLEKIKNIKTINEVDETLKELHKDTKTDIISGEDSRFIFEILSNIKNNKIIHEQVIDTKSSSQIAISVAPELNFNKGKLTTYFKVYRKPTKCSNNEPCLRISIFEPIYVLHEPSLEYLLDRKEKEELIKLLNSAFLRKENDRYYNQAFKMLINEYNIYLEQCKKNKIEVTIPEPKYLTNWNMILFHTMYQNNFSITISMMLPIPDYFNGLPTGKTSRYIFKK